MEEISYSLCSHAKQRLGERGIQVKWIEQVLRNPHRREIDDLNPTVSRSFGFIHEKGNKVLCVVYNRTKSPWVVITAYFV